MILVTGANGVIGHPLCRFLHSHNKQYLAVTRGEARASMIQWDLDVVPSAELLAQMSLCDSLIHCAPIWLLPEHVERLSAIGLKRMVVFSSTSVLSKRDSASQQERHLVALLTNAEEVLNQSATNGEIELTILRPSMIYGYGRDQNISHIARKIRQIRFMPLAGSATGLRQPVHADDLVSAALAVINRPATIGHTYNLAGGERLSYSAMVRRIFEGLNLAPRFIKIPSRVFQLLLKLAAMVGRFEYTSAMVDRMNEDLVYDTSPAKTDFGYAPQAFLTRPQRDLPR